MPTPTKGPRLGGSAAHQRHIMANLATALFEHGKITTTEAKARRLRPYAERLITFAKRGDLAARREVLTVVTDKGVVHTLFSEIGPRFATRAGGYTRIIKIGPRKGDNAPLAVIELVEEEATAAPSRRRRPRRPAAPARTSRPAAATATPASAEAPTEQAAEQAAAGHETAAAEHEAAAAEHAAAAAEHQAAAEQHEAAAAEHEAAAEEAGPQDPATDSADAGPQDAPAGSAGDGPHDATTQDDAAASADAGAQDAAGEDNK